MVVRPREASRRTTYVYRVIIFNLHCTYTYVICNIFHIKGISTGTGYYTFSVPYCVYWVRVVNKAIRVVGSLSQSSRLENLQHG